ncbi:MAG TPA: chemotaxis protein [Noviherbaspirillum sp.]|nr:chemotaxis protein [Noviherbaspirillum sp.]
MTTREKVFSAQLRRLLSGLSDHGTLHLTEIETDLVQTTFLLGEAIEKLGTSFMAIHESVCAQQRLADELLASATASPEFRDRMNTVQAEITKNVNAAVTGLQFQDMTSQLVGRTIRRVNGLRDVLASLGSGSSGLTPEIGAEEMVVLLESLNKLIEDQSTKLESGLWKAVHQTHMESGDIELF